ncbi:hypothetical protein AB0L97_34590 [Nocardia sp. NPDC051911]|uniref:hypothetical protein n=1 Tax=Nocardia sp. NPDC051911 TaxID=3154648 RepID=UPI0034238BEA
MANTSMVWFSLLNLDDRVALLAEPGMPLPRSLADNLRRMDPSYVVGEAVWTANHTGNAAEQLLPSLQGVLATYRELLLKWWKTLSADDQSVFIEHRDEAVPAQYLPIAQNAVGGALVGNVAGEPIDMEQPFSISPIARVFLEWKARERNS